MRVYIRPYFFIFLLLTLQSIKSLGCINKKDFFDAYITNGVPRDGKKIGEGGSCKVYLVDWRGENGKHSDSVQAVIKASKHLGDSGFENEEKIVSLLLEDGRIEHIPKVYGCYTDKYQRYFLVMQYIPKKISPPDAIGDKTSEAYKDYFTFYNLRPSQRLLIYRQMAQGLAEIHSRGVTHGDFKPQNVILDEISDKSKVYIADFGGSTVGQVRPDDYTDFYIDEEFWQHYKKNIGYEARTDKKVKYENGPKHDVYSLAVTIFVLENSINKDNNSSKWAFDMLGMQDITTEKIITIVTINLKSTYWMEKRDLNISLGTGDSFMKLFKSMTDEKREKRPTASEVAETLKSLSEGAAEIEKIKAQSMEIGSYAHEKRLVI